jgi:hypothetical protein
MEHPFPVGTRVKATNFLTGVALIGKITENRMVVSRERGWYVICEENGKAHDALAEITETI